MYHKLNNMKKTTLVIAACLMGIAALKAQITLNTADFPAVGDKFVVVNDSNTTYKQGAAGISVTWNFSYLADTITSIDTIKCVTPSSTLYSAFFPGSNVALEYSTGNLDDAFINNTSSSMLLDGVVENINSHPVPLVYRPNAQELYTFPGNYTSPWGSMFGYRLQVPIRDSVFDSVRVLSFVRDTNYIDAFGNCKTPLGTYNTLRRWEVQQTLDSTFLYDTATSKWVYLRRSITSDTSYQWAANGLGFPLLSMQIKNGHAKVASWLKKTSVTGIDEITGKAGSQVYPNPANTVLNIKLVSCQSGIVYVVDMAGRQISTTAFSNQLATLNTSALTGGMYFYRVSDKNGNMIDAGKFMVVK